MDGDAQVRFVMVLNELDEPEDLAQLWAMHEHLQGHMLMLDGLRLNGWRRQGFRPAPAGLRCGECGGPTWHKTMYSPAQGEVETVRCTALNCGSLREVRV